jgi:hypothetical protein
MNIDRGSEGSMHATTDRADLIGKPLGPVALDVANAFWESSLRLRVAFVLLAASTLVLGVLTAVGGAGVYDS